MYEQMKNRITKWNRSLKLRDRLFFTITAFVIVTIFIVLFIFLVHTSNIFTKSTEVLIEQSMTQTTDYLSFRLERIKDTSSQAYLDQEFKELIKDFKSSKHNNEKFNIYSKLLSKTNSFSLPGDIYSVRLYLDDPIVSEAPNSTILKEYLIQEESWYENVKSELGSIVWIPTYEHNYSTSYDPKSIISLARILKYDEYHRDYLGFFILDIKESLFQDILHQVSITEKGEVYLIDQSGYVLTSTEEDARLTYLDFNTYIDESLRYKTGQKDIRVDGKLKKVFHKRVPNSEWQLVSVIPREEIKAGTYSFIWFLGFILFIVASISLFLAAKISKNLTFRIDELSSKMNLVKDEIWDVDVTHIYEDELGDLQNNFMYMTEQLKLLMEDKKQSAIELRNAELRTLQAQINPHFLYNILDLINWLSIRHGAQDINDIVEKLAKFFRLSLSSGRNYVRIHEELEHIQLYVDIQNKRFEDRLNLEINMDEEILDFYTLKLIFQPLIENAIIHGISEKTSSKGKIIVNGYLELEHIVIEVIDDGVGMTQQEIENVLNFSKRNSYGIKNVNERLSLRFGPLYGVSYKSIKGEGTTATIIIPIIRDLTELD